MLQDVQLVPRRLDAPPKLMTSDSGLRRSATSGRSCARPSPIKPPKTPVEAEQEPVQSPFACVSSWPTPFRVLCRPQLGLKMTLITNFFIRLSSMHRQVHVR